MSPFSDAESSSSYAAAPFYSMAASTTVKHGAAGVAIFVHASQYSRFKLYLDALNSRDRVSDEVMKLFCVKPTRPAIRELCNAVKRDPSFADVEQIDKLKPNNSLRDFTVAWRIPPGFEDEFYMLVGLETVTDALRAKYPHPNLTLHAGKIEAGEVPEAAARRELLEETNISVHTLHGPPIAIMGKGMLMYSAYVMPYTSLYIDKEAHRLYIY